MHLTSLWKVSSSFLISVHKPLKCIILFSLYQTTSLSMYHPVFIISVHKPLKCIIQFSLYQSTRNLKVFSYEIYVYFSCDISAYSSIFISKAHQYSNMQSTYHLCGLHRHRLSCKPMTYWYIIHGSYATRTNLDQTTWLYWLIRLYNLNNISFK